MELFHPLYTYAFILVKCDQEAKEIVQHTFYSMWEKRYKLSINSSFKAYLYKSVYNNCLNHLKATKLKKVHSLELSDHLLFPVINENSLEQKELEEVISDALNELPEGCRTVFQLSRYEHLKNRELAAQLGISVKAVEAHITKALKILRTKLKDFLPDDTL